MSRSARPTYHGPSGAIYIVSTTEYIYADIDKVADPLDDVAAGGSDSERRASLATYKEVGPR